MTRGAWSPGSRLLTAGLVFMVTVTAFEGLAVPTVLPATLDEFGGLPLYGWAFAGFFLASLIGITVAGLEADRRGIIAPLLVGALLFAAGLLVSGLAANMEWVVAGRVIQGLGAGAIFSIVYVIIGRGYETAAQPRMIAIISSAWVIPGLVGPALAGYVAHEASWRWTFLALVPWLPLSALLLSGPLSRIPRPAPDAAAARSAAAVADAVRLAGGTGLVLGALTIRNPLLGIVMVAAGVALALAPLRRLLPAGALTAAPGRGAAVAVVAMVSVTFLGAEAFVPLAVSSVRSAGTVVGGLALTAAAVTWATGSWLAARFAAHGTRTGLLVRRSHPHRPGHRDRGGDPGHLAAGLGGCRWAGPSPGWGWGWRIRPPPWLSSKRPMPARRAPRPRVRSWPTPSASRSGPDWRAAWWLSAPPASAGWRRPSPSPT